LQNTTAKDLPLRRKLRGLRFYNLKLYNSKGWHWAETKKYTEESLMTPESLGDFSLSLSYFTIISIGTFDKMISLNE
jgi:hypothetical protein